MPILEQRVSRLVPMDNGEIGTTGSTRYVPNAMGYARLALESLTTSVTHVLMGITSNRMMGMYKGPRACSAMDGVCCVLGLLRMIVRSVSQGTIEIFLQEGPLVRLTV
jgi:hypothetical protein